MQRLFIGLFSLILLLGGLGVGVVSTTDEASAASCSATAGGYRSGSYGIGYATFKCTGMTGSGKVCIGSTCSAPVSIPSNGTSSSANVAYKLPTFCVSSSNFVVNAYINGSWKASKTVYYCQ